MKTPAEAFQCGFLDAVAGRMDRKPAEGLESVYELGEIYGLIVLRERDKLQNGWMVKGEARAR